MTQIIILGGGMGALSTAYYLTLPKNWKSHYSVTLYQQGWRLGGKCASSRNPAVGGRIQEHGLHVWFGFYENAFRMLRDCYAELKLPSPLDPRNGVFEGRDEVRMLEQTGVEFEPWDLYFPVLDGEPGLPGNMEPTPWSVYRALVEFINKYVRDESTTLREFRPGLNPWIPAYDAVLRLNPNPEQQSQQEIDEVITLLTEFRKAALHELRLVRAFARGAGRSAMVLDLLATISIGLLADKVFLSGLRSLVNEEFSDWLKRHGASNSTANVHQCVPLRALYDTCFAYIGGDVNAPNMAASTALGVSLRIGLTYRGYVLYTMLGGMGDVVVAPLYQVLQRRGVQFEFFHRVTKLETANDGSIARIRLARQATVKGSHYYPLVGKPDDLHFPVTPRYGELAEGNELEAQCVDLESFWYPNTWSDVGEVTLALKPTDKVVLGMALGALPVVCEELVNDNARWKRLLDNLPTIQTQSIQLWMKKTSRQLGWKGKRSPTMVAAPEPFDVWADMSRVLSREGWPAHDPPVSVHYFCGPMPGSASPGDPQAPADAAAEVKRAAKQWLLGYAGWLLRSAGSSGTVAINWDLLHTPNNLKGSSRLDDQWLHANINPTDRYVLSPNRANAYRLAPTGSEYKNLVLAGDWTETPINAGCVEAAVMSGMAASQHICGEPTHVYGSSFLLS